jgi:hypothetical protein
LAHECAEKDAVPNNSGADDAPSTSWFPRARETRPFNDRLRVSWGARYRTPETDSWLRCHVIDLSVHGAGFVLIDDTNETLSSVVVELSEPGSSYGLVLSGEVRHDSTVDGRRRVGVEFVDVGPINEWALREWVERNEPASRGG